MSIPTFLFRVDGDERIGAGHFMRSLALAESFSGKGAKVIFAGKIGGEFFRETLRKENIEWIAFTETAGSDEDAQKVIEIIRRRDIAGVVLDGIFNFSYQKKIKDAGSYLIVIDDFAHEPKYAADLILNPNGRNVLPVYEGKADKADVLSGYPFLLIRKEFTAIKSPRGSAAKKARKIFVSLGGATDTLRLLKGILHALTQIGDSGMEVRLFSGAWNEQDPELKRLQSAADFKITGTLPVKDMAIPMDWADLAVLLSGVTLWECLYMGCPVISFYRSSFQKEILRDLEKKGTVKIAGDMGKWSEKDLVKDLREMIENDRLRLQMSRGGQTLVDGKGAGRVADFILKRLERYHTV